MIYRQPHHNGEYIYTTDHEHGPAVPRRDNEIAYISRRRTLDVLSLEDTLRQQWSLNHRKDNEELLRYFGRIIDNSAREAESAFKGAEMGDDTTGAQPLAVGYDMDVAVGDQGETGDRLDMLLAMSQEKMTIPSAAYVPPMSAFNGTYDAARLIRAKTTATRPDFKPGSSGYETVDYSTPIARSGAQFVLDHVYWTRLHEFMAQSEKQRAAAESSATYYRGGRDSEYVDDLRSAMSTGLLNVVDILISEIPSRDWADALHPLTKAQRKTRRIKSSIGLTTATALLAAGGYVIPRWTGVAEDPRPTTVATASPFPTETLRPIPDSKQEKVNEGVCLTPEAVRLLELDCNKLPIISEDTTFIVSSSEEQIGIIKNGENDIASLPLVYQAAFEAALTDPLVKHFTKDGVVTRIMQTPEWYEENAYYDSRSDEYGFIFSTDARYPEGIFPTWGSIRTTFIHEGTHRLFQQWYDNAGYDDDITKNAVQGMTESCVADLGIALAKVKETEGPEMLDQLTVIQEELHRHRRDMSPGSYIATIAKVERLRQSIEDPSSESYIKDHLLIDEFFMGCGLSRGPGSAIRMEIDTKKMYGAKSFNRLLDALDELDELHRSKLSRQFSFMTESSVTPGLEGEGAGHPADEVTERAASLLTLVQTAPDKLVDNINNLPEERRRHAVNFIRAMATALLNDDSEVYLVSNMPYVLAKIG